MLPPNNHPFRVSRTALAIVVAAILLAVLLATMTIRNIRREEDLLQTFLLHEGMTLIRSFEAGARTTMMHRMEGIDPIITLVTETVKEDSVAYIRVVDDKGVIVASSGGWPAISRPGVEAILSGKRPFTSRLPDEGIFEIASPFKPLLGHPEQRMMMGKWGNNCGVGKKWRPDQRAKVIYLGLYTGEFDRARHVDVRHAFLLGGILFLAGCAGFYLLFIYQGMRVARRTLADMELYTNNIIESMPAGLITLDAAGLVVSCNLRAEAITGKSVAALVGKVLSEEIAAFPHLSPKAEVMVEQPFTCVHDDGSSIPVKMSSSVLHDGKGQVRGLVLIIKDVGDMLAMQEKLEQARRLSALGRMAAGIAHEIRNPLGTLRGFAQLFVRKFKGQPAEQDYARMMVNEVDRLNRTVSSLLQFSSPREAQMQHICLNDLLDKTVKFMADDFANLGIEFSLELGGEKIIINADPDLLLQTLLNLLHNSIAASEKGGWIALGASGDNDFIALWVADGGCGMDAAGRERMFDPFFTTKKSGTGLGLAVVHQIVSQHGAALEVETGPGQGTKIKIIFPVHKGRNHDEK